MSPSTHRSPLALLFLLTVGCTPTPPPPIEHVFVIGIDGMSPDGVRTADTPAMDRLMQEGAFTLRARGVLPTSSSPNWASMIAGAGPEQHGITSNDWERETHSLPPVVQGEDILFPTIFSLLHTQRPEAEIGAIYHWTGFGRLFEKETVDYDVSPDTEEATAQAAAAYIAEKRPTLCFIHFDHVDHAGHTYGHGTDRYYAAVARADSLIGVVLAAIDEAGLRDRSLVIVSADHGGIGTGHGGETREEIEIPFLMRGPGVRAGYAIQAPVTTIDNAPTVAFALGLRTPYAWTGRPVRSAFEGFPEPDLLYVPPNLLSAPVVYPRRNGYDPAGGLFVDTTPTVRIDNVAGAGDIRYTTDGSEPQAYSPRYTGPFDLAGTTVVRAALFEGDRRRSETSVGYFRILRDGARNGYGVRYRAYAIDNLRILPDFNRLQPAAVGTTHEPSSHGLDLPQTEDIAIVFDTRLALDAAGTYTFTVGSDDGSRLLVNGEEVVDNDGDHGVIERAGKIDLPAGRHALRVEWFNGAGGAWLGVFVEGPGLPRQLVPADRLFLP